ncbi:MAG: Nucleoside-diphosphate-sugar epimerases, partial [uncultured Sphingomonadaceae bacterium]
DRPRHRRRRVHRLQHRRSPRPRWPPRPRLRRAGPPRRGSQSRLAPIQPRRPDRGDPRRHPRRGPPRARGARLRRGLPHGRAGRGHDQPRRAARRFRDQHRGHAEPSGGAPPPGRQGPADLRQHQQGLWRPRRHRLPAGRRSIRPRRPGDPSPRHPRIAPARLPHALRLLQGRRRPVCPRLRPQLRAPHGGAPHELHLRPPPDGHGGSGLGRPFPDPRARRPPDHALRRRLPGPRHPRCGGRGGRVHGGVARHRPRVRPRVQSRRRPRQRGVPAHAPRPHRRADRPQGRPLVRGLARGRPALLRRRHPRDRGRARSVPRQAVAAGRGRARDLAVGGPRPSHAPIAGRV